MTDINITAPATVAVTMADASGSQTVTFTAPGSGGGGGGGGGGPGHGPAFFVPPNAQVVDGRSDGQNWGSIRVSAGVGVNTTDAEQYGHITYSACEINAAGWAEFGRIGEIKVLYEGCTAVFFADGVVLGPPDVALEGPTVYYTAGNYTGGGIIWRYAATGNYDAHMVINDFSASRGDILNIDVSQQGRGVTVSNFDWGTEFQLNGVTGKISVYGVTMSAADVEWA